MPANKRILAMIAIVVFCITSGLLVWLYSINKNFRSMEKLETIPVVDLPVTINFDHTGNLWVSHSDGIDVYKNGTQKPTHYQNTDDLIEIIVFGNDNQSWLIASQKIYTIDQDRIKTVYNLGKCCLSFISLDSKGNALIMDDLNKMLVIDKTTHLAHKWDAPNLDPDKFIAAMALDGNNMMWMATSTDVYSFDGSNLKIYDAPNDIHDMVFDRDNRLWIGKYNGISVLEGKIWKKVSPPGVEPGQFKFDALGRLWAFGGSHAICSLCVYDGKSWKYYFPKGDKDILADTWWSQVKSDNGMLRRPYPGELITDNKDNVWFASYRGVTKISAALPVFDLVEWRMLYFSYSGGILAILIILIGLLGMLIAKPLDVIGRSAIIGMLIYIALVLFTPVNSWIQIYFYDPIYITLSGIVGWMIGKGLEKSGKKDAEKHGAMIGIAIPLILLIVGLPIAFLLFFRMG